MDFVFSLNRIKKYDTQKRRILLKEIINSKNNYEEKILDLQALFNSSYSVYTKENRTEIKTIVDKLILEFKDYRSAILKDSLKKDLPSTVLKLCERELLSIQDADKVINQIQDDIRKEDLKINIRNKGYALADRIHPLRDEYVKNAETINKGIREWECLISLVEEGVINEEQLIEYGVILKN